MCWLYLSLVVNRKKKSLEYKNIIPNCLNWFRNAGQPWSDQFKWVMQVNSNSTLLLQVKIIWPLVNPYRCGSSNPRLIRAGFADWAKFENELDCDIYGPSWQLDFPLLLNLFAPLAFNDSRTHGQKMARNMRSKITLVWLVNVAC